MSNSIVMSKVQGFFKSSILKKVIFAFLVLFGASMITSEVVLASASALDPNAGMEMFTALISFLATWMRRIGGMVMFIGAIMFALATYNQSPEQRVNALMVLVAGAMVLGVGASYNFFIAAV